MNKWYSPLAGLVCWIWGHRRNASLRGYEYCRRCAAIHPPYGEVRLWSFNLGLRLKLLRHGITMTFNGRKRERGGEPMGVDNG